MNSMIHIDGSYGEGGGQILRYGLALSILTQTPVEIDQIRKNRKTPGLKPQHYTAVSLLKDLSDAEVKGLFIGSESLCFFPKTVRGGVFKIDVGTAGSITLIMQACLLLALQSENTITLRIRGGTDVQWSPSWDYFTHVFLHLLRMMGVEVKEELHQRGYYPKGGGEASVHIQPIKKLNGFQGSNSLSHQMIHGRIHCSQLPDHIIQRMKHMAIKTATSHDFHCKIKTTRVSSASAGVGLTLWMHDNHAVIGSSALGKKGVPAETIAQQAINSILQDVNAGVSVDEHLFDQLLPYLVFAQGTSICRVRQISGHAKTLLWLIQQFIDSDFYSIIEKKTYVEVQIDGVGLFQ